jgi:ribonuclease P protein subunit RPR2
MNNLQNKLAAERITILFRQAEEAAKKGDFDRAKRYVSLARTIAMKVQLAMPKEFKRRFCKKCQVYWIPSKTVRVRTHKTAKRIVFTCLSCGAIQRYPYVKEKKK